MTVEQVREGPSRGRCSRVGALALALLMGLTACATGAARGPPLQEVAESREEAFIAPLPTDFPPVQIGETELTSALTELVLQLPLRVAQSPRVYVGRRLAQLAPLPGRDGKAPAERKLTWDYARYCKQHGTPGDCLVLLEDGPVLQADDLRTLALTMAVGPALAGAGAEVGGLLSPLRVVSTVSFALVTYLTLLMMPEPLSKGVAAVFTVWLWGYLGWEFFELVRAYSHLREEAPRATSFAEVQQVGERFGRVIGPNSVRILVLLGTAAVGGGLGPTAKGPKLPGMAQVSRMTRVRLGQELTDVATASEQVIVCAPEGTLRFVLAPTVVAMAAGGGSAGGAGSSQGPPTPKGYRAWKSFSGFKRAMGPAGPGKQWHHLVEQTPGNVSRFGGEALHNTENIVALDKALHERISSLYSSIRPRTTGSDTLTVRAWLSTQSYEAQLDFAYLAMRNILGGVW